MPYTSIDNLPLFYELEGQSGVGCPVIFVNGWCQSARYWDITAHALAKRWSVVTFDSRGFGRSLPRNRNFPPDFHVNIDEGAAEIEKLLAKLDLGSERKFHVVGHSLGGVTAVHFAALAQQRGQLQSLTIVNSGSFEPNARQGDTLNNFVKILMRVKRFFGLPIVRNLVVARSVALPIPDRYVRIIAQDFEVSDARLAVELSFSSLSEPSLRRYRAELTQLNVPLLLIVGDKDATIPPAGMYNIKKFKPQSKLVPFPDCGHLPMLEQPTRFAQVLANHLQTSEAAGQRD